MATLSLVSGDCWPAPITAITTAELSLSGESTHFAPCRRGSLDGLAVEWRESEQALGQCTLTRPRHFMATLSLVSATYWPAPITAITTAELNLSGESTHFAPCRFGSLDGLAVGWRESDRRNRHSASAP